MCRHRRITNTVTAHLHLESHARSSTSMPLFFSSDTVRGRLEIDVKHEVKIKAIKLVVGLFARLRFGPVPFVRRATELFRRNVTFTAPTMTG